MKEKLTAWPLKVAECEHQFKAIDEAQQTFGERNDAEGHQVRVFGGTEEILRNYGKVGDHLNGMIALENVGTHDARTIQSDQDASNDMSYDDVCAIAWKGYEVGKGAGKKRPNGAGTWYRGEGTDEWVSGE